MTNASANADFVNLFIAEMASVAERAVECWLAQVEQALTDPRLTTLEKLNAVREIVSQYKILTGKTGLQGRTYWDG